MKTHPWFISSCHNSALKYVMMSFRLRYPSMALTYTLAVKTIRPTLKPARFNPHQNLSWTRMVVSGESHTICKWVTKSCMQRSVVSCPVSLIVNFCFVLFLNSVTHFVLQLLSFTLPHFDNMLIHLLIVYVASLYDSDCYFSLLTHPSFVQSHTWVFFSLTIMCTSFSYVINF